MGGRIHLQIKKLVPSVPLVFTWWNLNEGRTEAILVECDCFKQNLSDKEKSGKDWAKKLRNTLDNAEVVSLNRENAEVLGFEKKHWEEDLGRNKWLYGLDRKRRQKGLANVQINLVQEKPVLKETSSLENLKKGTSVKDKKLCTSTEDDTCIKEHLQVAVESLQKLKKEVIDSHIINSNEDSRNAMKEEVDIVAEGMRHESDNGAQEFTVHNQALPNLSVGTISEEGERKETICQAQYETVAICQGGRPNEEIAIPVKVTSDVGNDVAFEEVVEEEDDNIQYVSGSSLMTESTENGNITITDAEGDESSANTIKVALSSLGVCGGKDVNLDAVVIQQVDPSGMVIEQGDNPSEQTVVVPLNSSLTLDGDMPEGTVSLTRFLEDLFQNQGKVPATYGKVDALGNQVFTDNIVILNQPVPEIAGKDTKENEPKTDVDVDTLALQSKLQKLNTGKFYVCEVCGKVVSKRYMKSHAKAHQKGNDPAAYSRKQWTCEICGKVLITDKKTHMRRHTGEKPFNCRYCEEMFVSTSERFFHERRKHTHEYHYQCSLCPRKFLKQGSLLRHEEAHKRGTINKQGNVSKPFDRKKYQQEHYAKRKTQIGTCKYCGKNMSMTALYEHQRRHLNLRRFQCSVCSSNFTTKGNLMDHMNIHTGETPYKCNVCGKGYTRRYSLIVHMRSHTGERPFSCPLCNKGWRESYGYKLHMQKHHPELVDVSVRVRPRKKDK